MIDVTPPTGGVSHPEKGLVVSFEEGLMDTLFEEGFLFFDTPMFYRKSTSEEGTLSLAVEAQADYLLSLTLLFREGKVRYSLFQVGSHKKLEDKTLLLPSKRNLALKTYYRALGRRIGEEVASLLSPV